MDNFCDEQTLNCGVQLFEDLQCMDADPLQTTNPFQNVDCAKTHPLQNLQGMDTYPFESSCASENDLVNQNTTYENQVFQAPEEPNFVLPIRSGLRSNNNYNWSNSYSTNCARYKDSAKSHENFLCQIASNTAQTQPRQPLQAITHKLNTSKCFSTEATIMSNPGKFSPKLNDGTSKVFCNATTAKPTFGMFSMLQHSIAKPQTSQQLATNADGCSSVASSSTTTASVNANQNPTHHDANSTSGFCHNPNQMSFSGNAINQFCATYQNNNVALGSISHSQQQQFSDHQSDSHPVSSHLHSSLQTNCNSTFSRPQFPKPCSLHNNQFLYTQTNVSYAKHRHHPYLQPSIKNSHINQGSWVHSNQIICFQNAPNSGCHSETLSEKHVCQWQVCYPNGQYFTCGEVFQSICELVEHMAEAHRHAGKIEGNKYVCRWLNCEKNASGHVFQNECKLKLHLRIHTGEKPFECKICHKRFARNENLTIHFRTHTQEKPYPCLFEGCTKMFGNCSDRSKHTPVHYTTKNFACKMCNKRYKHPSSLKKHKCIILGDLLKESLLCELD